MIKVGIAGVGFMGWIHWLAYSRTKLAEVAAVLSRDEKKRQGDWRGIQGNFGPPGEQVDLAEIAGYGDLQAMLDDPRIDVVDVCFPPHLHVETIERALDAGKHVFCEKPLTVSADEADHLVKRAATANRLLLVGHVLPFFPEFAFARQAVQSGEYGKVLAGYFKRVISDPTWLDDFYDPQKCGGPLIDLHVHDAHLIRFLFGMPQRLFSVGRMRDEVVEFCHTVFEFPDSSLTVAASSGVIQQQGRPFNHGFELQLEKATLQFEFAAFADGPASMPLKLLKDDGQVETPSFEGGDEITPFIAEVEEMARSVENNQVSPILSGDLARDAILLCHKQTESVKSGKLVSV